MRHKSAASAVSTLLEARNPSTCIAQKHTSVLLQECMEALNLRSNLCYVDGTLGLGGHSEAMLSVLTQLGGGVVVGVDQDTQALALATERLHHLQCPASVRFLPVHANYSELPSQWERLYTQPALGIPERIEGGLLLDLGVSSMQLDEAERGFSFLRSGPLDMRMNASLSTLPTAADIVNTWEESALADCFFLYGEEQFSRSIARAIVHDRQTTPWTDTLALAQLIERVYYSQQKKRQKKQEQKHPATRVFQALRIAVNGELTHLEATLKALPQLMAPQSRVAIMTFHSLEDRLVKQYFKLWCTSFEPSPHYPDEPPARVAIAKAISKKPYLATAEELAVNPRSRSAKLRVIEFL
jgi:16S rRNA (cytosine1402-N4)-methyltransferase